MADSLIAADLRKLELSSPPAAALAGTEARRSPELSEYAFRRMTFVEAAPAFPTGRDADPSANPARAVIRDIHFPSLANPETPARMRFNSVMEQRPRFRRDELTNEVVDYEIVYAGKDLISVRFDCGVDTIGAAHPWGSSYGATVLMDSGHLLEAGDVFSVETGWQDFITTRAADDISRQLDEYDFTPTAADVRGTAIDVRQWLITENALVLLFPTLSFGAPYVAGSVEVAIPWSDLAPFLSAQAPAPIAA